MKTSRQRLTLCSVNPVKNSNSREELTDKNKLEKPCPYPVNGETKFPWKPKIKEIEEENKIKTSPFLPESTDGEAVSHG